MVGMSVSIRAEWAFTGGISSRTKCDVVLEDFARDGLEVDVGHGRSFLISVSIIAVRRSGIAQCAGQALPSAPIRHCPVRRSGIAQCADQALPSAPVRHCPVRRSGIAQCAGQALPSAPVRHCPVRRSGRTLARRVIQPTNTSIADSAAQSGLAHMRRTSSGRSGYEAVDRRQRAPHAHVEAAGRHIDVLGFDLQKAAATNPGPLLDFSKGRRPIPWSRCSGCIRISQRTARSVRSSRRWRSAV